MKQETTIEQFYYRQNNRQRINEVKHKYLTFVAWFCKNTYAQLAMKKEFEELMRFCDPLINGDFNDFVFDSFNNLAAKIESGISEYEKDNEIIKEAAGLVSRIHKLKSANQNE